MSKKKKINILIWVLSAFLVVSALLPIFISLGRRNENKIDNVVITDVNLDIVDYSIEFQQNSMTINLLSGEITTNKRIDNVFINVNGCGCQYLSYSQTLNTDGYYDIFIEPTSNIVSATFNSDTKITADIYVEYANRSHKVVSRNIDVKESWNGVPVIDFPLIWL